MMVQIRLPDFYAVGHAGEVCVTQKSVQQIARHLAVRNRIEVIKFGRDPMPLAQIRDRRNRALERKRPPVVCQEEFSVDELGLNPAITVTQKVLRELPESIATARH